jgi:hypothetical protein
VAQPAAVGGVVGARRSLPTGPTGHRLT